MSLFSHPAIHPATLFRTLRKGGNRFSLTSAQRCSYDEGRPADQADVITFVLSDGDTRELGEGLPQCSRFHRAPGLNEGDEALDRGPGPDYYTDEVGRNAFTFDGNVPRVYPKGVGHPFTGQPWASEIAALSFNLMSLLVARSSEFVELSIPNGIDPELFPLVRVSPLAYATFDPNDPDNASRIAEIDEIIANQPDSEASRAEIQALRAAMKPICSFITPAGCDKIRELLSYTARIADGDPEAGRALRYWLWETGAEYAVDQAVGSLTDVETVHVAGPRLPEITGDESEAPAFAERATAEDELEFSLLLIDAVPEPQSLALQLAALASLVVLARRARRTHWE